MKQKILFIFSALFLSGLIYASFFNVFQTDDYTLYNFVRERGHFGNIRQMYSGWSGRLWSFFSIGFITDKFIDSIWFPVVYPISILLSFLVLLYLNIRIYTRQNIRKSIALSVVFSAMFFLSLFHLGESFYWFTGTQVYFVANLYVLVFLYWYKKFPALWARFPLVFILLSGGIIFSNEITAIVFLAFTFFVMMEKKDSSSKLVFFSALVFYLIMFTAPGNFVRGGENLTNLMSLVKRFGKLIFAIPILLAIKTIVPALLIAMAFREDLEPMAKKISARHWLISSIIIISPIVFMAVVGRAGGRILDGLMLYVLAFLVFSCAKFMQKKFMHNAVFMLCIIVVLIPKNIFPERVEKYYYSNGILVDICNNTLPKFSEEYKKRMQHLAETTEDEVLLEPIKNIPKSLYFEEIPPKSSNEINFINEPLMRYFNKKGIWLNK